MERSDEIPGGPGAGRCPGAGRARVRAWRRATRYLSAIGVAVLLGAAGSACGAGHPRAGSSSGSTTTSPPVPTTTGGPLVAPRTSTAQDAQYFTDLAAVDPALSSYMSEEGNVALAALLTDGSAFCAFLARGSDVDDAMASVVIGANGEESKTHLPSDVSTYNAIDAVALVVLCPGEQAGVPTADRSRIQALTRSLSSHA